MPRYLLTAEYEVKQLLHHQYYVCTQKMEFSIANDEAACKYAFDTATIVDARAEDKKLWKFDGPHGNKKKRIYPDDE
jgi:hypothetical protein